MKHLQQILWLLILCSNTVLYAQTTEYDPNDPPEPENLFSLTLNMNSTNAGYISGAGNYPEGKSVRVYAGIYSGYQFVAWKEGDSIISTASDFYYIMPARRVGLTAHYLYTPGTPGEPNYKYTVKLWPDPVNGGYFGNDNQFYLPGTEYYIYAYPHTGFIFTGWYRGDSLVSNATPYKYKTGLQNDTLRATFKYQPGGPTEPGTGTAAKYNLSMLTMTTEAGKTIPFTVHLFNQAIDVLSAGFDLQFPEGAMVDMTNAALSSRKNGHLLTVENLELPNQYRITVADPEQKALFGSSGILLTIPVTVPTDWKNDSIYPVKMANATVTVPTGTVTCPAKQGGILLQSEQGNLFASFYPDIFLNRAYFRNLSSESATSYLWNFGDGTTSTDKNPLHIYTSGGNYNVQLKVFNGEMADSASFNILISPKTQWKISGSFHLDPNLKEVKNFTTADEMFTLFSQGDITGNISVNTAENQTFDVNMSDSMLIYLQRIQQKLSAGKFLIYFNQTDTLHPPVLNFRENIDQTKLNVIMAVWKQFRYQNVITAIENTALKMSEFTPVTLCTNTASPEIDFTGINPLLNYSWQINATPALTTGYLSSGTQQIPSMTPVNPSDKPDTLRYDVNTVIPNTSFTRLFTQEIIILPQIIGNFTNLAPDNQAVLNSTQVQFSWTAVKNAVYDIYLWPQTGTMPVQPTFSGITQANFTNNGVCKYGESYHWKVVARGTCNQVSSDTASFRIRVLPDLEILSAQYPDTMYAGDQVTVQVNVINHGGDFNDAYWRDDISLSRSVNLDGILTLTGISSWKKIQTDSIYSVDFKFTLPLDTVRYTRFVFKTDVYNYILESNESNNIFVSHPITIIQPTIADEDFLKLKSIYQQLGGKNWKRKWNINSNVIIASNWPGLNFKRGRVSEISMADNALKGYLPAQIFTFPQLTLLELQYNNLTGNLSLLSDSIGVFSQKADSLKILNLSYNQLQGEISRFAAHFPWLTRLHLSGNTLSLDTVLSKRIDQLNLHYQKVHIDSIDMEAHPSMDGLPKICTYNHTDQNFSFRPAFNLNKDNGYAGYLQYYSGQYHLSWNNSSGWIFDSGTPLTIYQVNGVGYGCESPFKMFFQQGDANVDKKIDLLDVQHSLNFMLMYYPDRFNFNAGNTFKDDRITVQDLVKTIHLVLNTVMPPAPALAPGETALTARNSLYLAGNQLMLKAGDEVAAIDFGLKNCRIADMQLKLNPLTYQMQAIDTETGLRCILYSPVRSVLTGDVVVAELNAEQASISHLQLADIYAQPLSARIGQQTTALPDNQNDADIKLNWHNKQLIVNTLQTLNNTEITIFNLQGTAVYRSGMLHLTPGTHQLNDVPDIPAGLYPVRVISGTDAGASVLNQVIFITK